MNAPILDKRPSHGYDYKPFTWSMFIKLREWAKSITDRTGWKVYLVGSTLEKELPRDIDVSVIMPFEEYERLYGKWPEDKIERNQYMYKVWEKNVKYYFEADEVLEEGHIDLKFCPDTWWTDKDKLLLAE